MKPHRSFDLIIGLISLILLLLLAGVLWRGDRTHPYLKASNPNPSTQVSADLKQVTLTFNREMNKQTVEENFQLIPPVEGQFSWVGRRMAYSFTQPLAYHQKYQLSISQAQDLNGRPLQKPFVLEFSTPSQSLFYINQNAQLVRYNLETEMDEVLSPDSLEVVDYRMHPDRSTFYLLVKEGQSEKEDEFISLYEMDSKTKEIILLVDGHRSKIFDWRISPDGKWLLAGVSKFYPLGEFWVTDPATIRLMNTQNRQWQDFWWKTLYETPLYFSNDSQFLLGVDYTGDALILPLEEGNFPPVQLGAYSGIHGISTNGRSILLSRADSFLPETDLMVRKNDGSTQVIAEGLGEVISPAFDVAGAFVYFLLTHFDYEGLDYVESFSLEAYSEFFTLYRFNLASAQFEPLIVDDNYAQGDFDFSADGKTMVMERYPTKMPSGETFSMLNIFKKQTPELWKMDLESKKIEPFYFLGKKPILD